MPDSGARRHQLLRFRLPSLPKWDFAVTVQEVLIVTDIENVRPLPFAPAYTLGVTEWQDRLLTVVDLAAALTGGSEFGHARTLTSTLNAGRCIVARVLIRDTIPETVAWPVSEAATLAVPAQAMPATQHIPFDEVLVHTAVMLEDRCVVILRLEGLAEGVALHF